MKKTLGNAVASIGGLALALGVCGLAWGADTIKFGVAGPHSGDLASYGIPTKQAAELIIKEVNAKGGVLGRQIELLVEDDVCKPEIATNTATKLVSEKAEVVLQYLRREESAAAHARYGINGEPLADGKLDLPELLEEPTAEE